MWKLINLNELCSFNFDKVGWGFLDALELFEICYKMLNNASKKLHMESFNN